MAVPIASLYTAPITDANRAAKHQLVRSPAQGSFAPSHYNPVPVAANLKGGTTGTAYSETINAQGGSSPYTFAVTAGALPSGTTMSSGGVISGTTSAAGTFGFTVTVTDSLGYTGSYTFSISVAAPSGGSGYSATFLS
jgi:large repetitive protein